MRINEANDLQNVRQHGGYRAWVQKLLRLRWGWTKPLLWSEPKGETRAYVLRSNWVADCPHCNSTSVVQPGNVFYCPDCGMQGNALKPAALIMPAARADIEATLLKRPDPVTRNWLLTETVVDLQRENAEHGVGE